MSIARESGSGPRFGRVSRCGYSASLSASAGRGSSSVGRDSDSTAAAAQWEWDGEEVESGDGEVQSSYKGSPFDTMDALQEALPFRRISAMNDGVAVKLLPCEGTQYDQTLHQTLCKKGVYKFYNGKSGSFGQLPDTVVPSPRQKDLPKPATPSPRKRKGFLPFTFKWGKPQHKEVFPEDVVDSPVNCRRMTLSPVASSSSGSNSGSDDEYYLSGKPFTRRTHRRPGNVMDVFASPPAPLPSQLNPVRTRSQSMLELQDVTDSTAVVTPRDKRMKNQQGSNLGYSQEKVNNGLAKPDPSRASA